MIARFVPGHGHAWFGWRPDLHVRTVEAWLTGDALPEELKTEPPSPSAVDRVLRRLDKPQGRATYVPPPTPMSRLHAERSRTLRRRQP